MVSGLADCNIPAFALSSGLMRLPLNRKEFRDALKKGLGRAVLHARRYGLDGMDNELRWALLQSQVYDPQCEWHRPAWLWKVMRAGRCEGRHRAAVLAALARSKEYRDLQQLSHLAYRYARAGDAAAKKALYAAFERLVGSDHHGIERELMRVDGTAALRRVADRVGKELAKGGDQWEFGVGRIWRHAKDEIGAAAASRALKGGNSRTRLFLERARSIDKFYREERLKGEMRRKTEGEKRRTWADLKSELDGPRVFAAPTRWFAMRASDGDLKAAFAALEAERRPLQAGKLLQVFVTKRPPEWKPFLLKFTRSRDEYTPSRAWDVLAHFRRPEMRRLAVKAAKRRRDVANGSLTLFKKNYRRGDHRLLTAAMSGRWHPEEAHCIGMSIRDIAEARADRALAPVFAAAYEMTPCALCRTAFFKDLLRIKAAPDWMIEECVEDTDEGTRSAAKEAVK